MQPSIKKYFILSLVTFASDVGLSEMLYTYIYWRKTLKERHDKSFGIEFE